MKDLLRVVLVLFLLPPPLFAQLLNQIRTEDLDLVYLGPAFSYVLPHIGACSQNALDFHRRFFEWTPSEEISLFVEDFSDAGRGGANTVPSNFINYGIAPFNYVYETVPAIDRMYWMANHEMAHIATMDQAAGRDELYRTLFRGKVEPVAESPVSILYNYLTNPRWNAPRWYHEGIATFLETWMAGGLGRALIGYDEMVFRTMVRDDSHFYDVVGLESEGTTIDFQVGVNSYLYGTRFMSYLAYRYGPEKLVEWTARKTGSKAHFAAQFRHVYRTSLDEEWTRWIEWEHEWQEENLERVRENAVTPFRPLTDEPIGSASRAFYDPQRQRIYLGINYPGRMAHIAALDVQSGDLERLVTVKGPALYYVTSLAYDRENDLLFFTTDNYGWRDLNSLDLETGKSRRLMRDGRIGDLAFNPADRSLWGVRHFSGISTLVRIPPPYTEWDQIHSWPYGQDLYDIDISPDGTTLTGALAFVDGQQKLIRMQTAELMAGEAEVTTLFDFENSSPSNFAFSLDGRYLYGSSYYSGVSNIYRYDLLEEDMSIVSNYETGLFRPVPLSEEEVIAFQYTGEGLVPGVIPNRPLERVGSIRYLGTEIARRHPMVTDWGAGSPAEVDLEELTVREGPYRPLSNVELESVYPIIEGYKDSEALGFRLTFGDGFHLTGFDLTLSVSPFDDLEDDERIHFVSNFHYWNWKLRATYNGGDFYDLFGPTKRSRKGYSLGVGWEKTLAYDEPRAWRFGFDLTGWGGIETLPGYQNVPSTTDELLIGAVSLDYEFLRRSLGGVDDEKGIKWSLNAATNWAGSGVSPQIFNNFDYGFPLPIRHSSIFFRTSVGYSFGELEETSDLFYFGGFGNNYVDYRTEKRYREFYSFPGVELNEISARNYAKGMVEWNLPPLRFRRVGSPSFYMNWLRPAIFVAGLETNLDERVENRTIGNVGAQIDFKLVIFSNLSSMLSIGYARVFEQDRTASDEIMISLKIL